MFQGKPVKDQLEVRLAPPPPRGEALPPHRPGHVWIPGYWDWRNAHHSWVVGHWEPERRGCHWKPHRWVSRDGRWFLQPGGWAPDEFAIPVRPESMTQHAVSMR